MHSMVIIVESISKAIRPKSMSLRPLIDEGPVQAFVLQQWRQFAVELGVQVAPPRRTTAAAEANGTGAGGSDTAVEQKGRQCAPPMTRSIRADSPAAHRAAAWRRRAAFFGGIPVDAGVGHRAAIFELRQVVRNRLVAAAMFDSIIADQRAVAQANLVDHVGPSPAAVRVSWLLACEQSTTMFGASLALTSACSAIETENGVVVGRPSPPRRGPHGRAGCPLVRTMATRPWPLMPRKECGFDAERMALMATVRSPLVRS